MAGAEIRANCTRQIDLPSERIEREVSRQGIDSQDPFLWVIAGLLGWGRLAHRGPDHAVTRPDWPLAGFAYPRSAIRPFAHNSASLGRSSPDANKPQTASTATTRSSDSWNAPPGAFTTSLVWTSSPSRDIATNPDGSVNPAGWIARASEGTTRAT